MNPEYLAYHLAIAYEPTTEGVNLYLTLLEEGVKSKIKLSEAEIEEVIGNLVVLIPNEPIDIHWKRKLPKIIEEMSVLYQDIPKDFLIHLVNKS